MDSRTLRVLFFSIYFIGNQASHNFVDDDRSASHGDTIHASILFRHGDRTPNILLPTDPRELSYWEEGTGQLTKLGKQRAYELGKWIRWEYEELVSNKPYRYDVITVNSSDKDRTLMTAELVLAGLYPPSNEEMWNNENLRWQPIPVHSIPFLSDNLLEFPDGICERYELEKKYSLNKDDYIISFYEEHRDILEYVSIHSGVDLPQDDLYMAIGKMSEVYHTLFIEVENNRTPQPWTRSVFPQPIKSIADFAFSLPTYIDEMKRLRAGPLLKSIVDDITRKVTNGTKNTKFHLYSAHDKTIATLLDALGVFNRLIPPFTAAVVIELRKKDENYFVKVLYRNSSLAAPYLLEIPGCESNVCTLNEFIRVAASQIPEDWNKECEVGFLEKFFVDFTFNNFLVLGIVVLLSAVMITIAGRLYFRTRHKHYETIQDSNDGGTF